MKEFGFKDCSNGNFEIYEKHYETFRLVVSRHHRNDEQNKFEVWVIDSDDCNREVLLIKNIDKYWVLNFDKLF